MLTWNVYVENVNGRKIVEHNIFNHYYFLDGCIKAAKKFKNDREKFEEAVKTELMYYYWSKCEWEIVITSWPERQNFEDVKIDVYDQVMMNWDIFIDWLWDHKKELKHEE